MRTPPATREGSLIRRPSLAPSNKRRATRRCSLSLSHHLKRPMEICERVAGEFCLYLARAATPNTVKTNQVWFKRLSQQEEIFLELFIKRCAFFAVTLPDSCLSVSNPDHRPRHDSER